jgi:phosphoribosylanthranilate isomerase
VTPHSSERRTIVKVCGLTRLEDARMALDAGADWLGFVVKADRPRAITPEAAARIVEALGDAHTVAVMVSPTPEEALAIARRMGAARVQLHRVDPSQWPEDFPLPITFGVGMDANGRPTTALPAERHLVLLDTAHPTLPGGTGLTFPWTLAAELAARRPVLLAGGLDAENVGEAIERVRPFGVDASSRLESSMGIKDPERVRRFVAAVRASDERRLLA